MLTLTAISTTSLNIIRSSLFFCRHRFLSFIRFILLLLVCVLLLYFFSVCYYSFYCTYRFHSGLIEANQRRLWNTRDGVQGQFMPILMPVCDRPYYLERVLDGLAEVDGMNEVRGMKSLCHLTSFL